MKKLLVFLIAIALFSCSKEAENKVQPADEISFSLEERNVNWLRMDSVTYDHTFQVLYFQDKGKRRQLGIFSKSPFLLYPNQTLLIDKTINVNIKRDNLGREYLIFKNK